MMKKRNSLMFLVLLLVGCSQQPKEEGPQKIAVIIKEGVGHGKPKISKLIFLEGDTNELILVQVEN